MAAAATTTALSMKLLIDTKARRVLFAEASKDVVDFFLLAWPSAPPSTKVKQVGCTFCIATASYAAPATTPESVAAVRLCLPTDASSCAWSRCNVRAAVRCEFAAATASSTVSPATAPGSSEEHRGHELGVQAPPPDLLPRLIDHLHAILGYGSVPCRAEMDITWQWSTIKKLTRACCCFLTKAFFDKSITSSFTREEIATNKMEMA
ncbi:hypothetical protein ZWY2020_034543 [Hordeum vulgare]|nr:hypothetical protein ZWY2020_034543 [Hordeum vulgare]